MQSISKMRTTQSNAEVLQVLSAIQDRKEQATQIILASIGVLDHEQRTEIIAMLFNLPLADDGLSVVHLPLLTQLYVKTALCPHFSLALEQQRTFLKNDVLNWRLLSVVCSLLHADFRITQLPGKPMPSLLRLLESVRGSSSLRGPVHKMIEDAIIVVKRGIDEDELKEDELKKKSPAPQTIESMLSLVEEPMVTANLSESIPAEPPLSKSSLTIPLSCIALFMSALGLLWVLHKRRS